MNELKPCPFCGKSVAELSDAQDLENCANFEDEICPCSDYELSGRCGMHIVVCDVNQGGCGAASGYYTSTKKAIEAWNRRINDHE